MKNVALITGASEGIGKQLALIHACRKGDLVIVARRLSELKNLKAELEKKYPVVVRVIGKDLSQPDAASGVYDELKNKGIEIDYLINNAGFAGQGNFWKQEWLASDTMINLNIKTVAEMCHLFLPDFLERNEGKIMNISAASGLIPGPLQAVYQAGKAFINSFSEAIAEELKGTAITVTTLLPGTVNTRFFAKAGLENNLITGRMVDSLKVAEQGYNAMLKGKRLVFAGLTFADKITASLLPFIPNAIVMKHIKKMNQTHCPVVKFTHMYAV